MAGSPPTRWALGGEKNAGYGRKFAELVATGEDVDGEARLADALSPRHARILDAGSGMGRVAAYLDGCGHRVVATEPDTRLVEQSRAIYPDVEVLPHDILDLSPVVLADAGGPTEFDLIVCVGNVIAFLAEGTEVAVLERFRELLAPTGRVLVGFHLVGGPHTARRYAPDEFVADVRAAGLAVEHRFGSYELHPPNDEYAVWVLSRPDAAGAAHEAHRI